MKGDKEGLMNQKWTCLTSLFLKLVISTLKKPWEEVKHKGVVGIGVGAPALQVANKCLRATTRRTGPDRALPSRNRQRVPARARQRTEDAWSG
jgi:hypothetical protein